MTERDPRLRDFRNFLYLVWKYLNLPAPTEIQYDFADFVANGPERLVAEGFRGLAKSWITATYATWRLYWDPDCNIVIVSASQAFADDISTFILQQIELIPELQWLSPKTANRERASRRAFDVGPAQPNKQPSVKAMGVLGQLTGNRADVIIGDDVETLANSITQMNREKLIVFLKELDSIVKPGGRIVLLGTPQTEQTIYNDLATRGYSLRMYPVRYPEADRLDSFGGRLAPIIRDAVLSTPGIAGKSVEPSRFNDLDLAVREAALGRSSFALQFLLDTTLSDISRYPLKLKDLIFMDVPADIAPGKIVWSSEPRLERKDLPNVGFGGDRMFAPIIPEGIEYMPFQGCTMSIDPAGTGEDETAFAIGKVLNGNLYVPEATGLPGGYSEATLTMLAARAKAHKVNRVVVEKNFGDGMFTRLLSPFLARIHPCAIEEVHHSKQKELRIIDTLEPLMNSHRLILDPNIALKDDYRAAQLAPEKAPQYRLFYQMTRLTKERGCLKHDDRLDALAIMAASFEGAVGRDDDKALKMQREKAWEKELKTWEVDMFGAGRAKKDVWMGLNAGIR